MMKKFCTLGGATLLAVLLVTGTAHAQQDCQPGIALAFAAHPAYVQLYGATSSLTFSTQVAIHSAAQPTRGIQRDTNGRNLITSLLR